ncbi:MAG: HD-GYP domain-containing protein [Actinomycetota bacterium]
MEQPKNTARSPDPGRWSSRPYLSGLLRLFIFLFPTAASLTTATVLARLLHPPTGGLSTATWWGAILGTSLVVLFVLQRLTRRLMPLALLLKLTLTFPDRAPSRYRVARRSGNLAELRNRLALAKQGAGGEGLEQAAETIVALAAALGTHDRHTRGHSERVRVFTDMLAEELKIPVADRDRLRWAALLHDVGKLEVPAAILDKAGPLDEKEWGIVRQHPSMGMRLIGPLVAWLGPQATTIEHHHEHFDGGGYPNGVGGEEISIGGRVVSVADAYDTMTAARSYKKPLSAVAAREELSRCAGKQFDPGVVRAMMNISLGRLWWRVGVLSWLAQIPLVGPVSRFMGRTTQTAGAVTGATAAAAVIGIAGITVPVSLDTPVVQPESHQVALGPPTEVQSPPTPDHREAPRNSPTADESPTPTEEGATESFAAGAVVGPPSESSGSGGSGGGGEGQGDEATGGEGSDDGGGGEDSDDENLIRYVVETVRDAVDELRPAAGG